MRHRKRLLVDPEVQYSIGLRILKHWALFILCLCAIHSMLYTIAYAGSASFATSVVSALQSQIPLCIVAVLLVPAFLRDTLRLTNRFAGPMYRLRRSIERLADGDTTEPLRFRRGDFWQPVAENFNVVIRQVDELRLENARLQSQVEGLQRQLAAQSELANDNSPYQYAGS